MTSSSTSTPTSAGSSQKTIQFREVLPGTTFFHPSYGLCRRPHTPFTIYWGNFPSSVNTVCLLDGSFFFLSDEAAVSFTPYRGQLSHREIVFNFPKVAGWTVCPIRPGWTDREFTLVTGIFLGKTGSYPFCYSVLPNAKEAFNKQVKEALQN